MFISQYKKYLNSFIYTFFIIFSLFILSPNAFSAPTFTATVDKTSISIEEQITLTLNLVDEKISNIDLYSLKDFDAQFRNNSSEIQIINGDFKSTESFVYVLTPKRAGNLLIEPITININGQDYSTQPINITVTNVQKSNSATNNSIAFITAELSDYTPYLSQQIIYTFRYYRRVETNHTNVEYPEFNDFWVENLGKEEAYETIINGQKYIVNQIKKSLFPTKIGKITISPTKAVTEIVMPSDDNFFGMMHSSTETKRLSSNPLVINVKPLPIRNKPSNYNNLVGKNLQLLSSMTTLKANVGDSVTLKLTIKGNGNIGDVGSIDIPIDKNIKIYKNKPIQKKYLANGVLFTEKNFEIAIVPLKRGKIIIPSVKVPYFDTAKGIYKDLSSRTFELDVIGKDEQVLQSIQNLNIQKDVEILGQDIFSIYQDLDALKNQGKTPLKIILYILWFLIPISLYSLIIFTKSDKFTLWKNKANSKQNSYNAILKKIITIENNLEQNEKALDEISILFQNYIFNHFKLMPIDLLNKVLKNNELSKFSEDLKILLEKLEFLKFSGSNISLNEKKDIIILTKKVLAHLESLNK